MSMVPALPANLPLTPTSQLHDSTRVRDQAFLAEKTQLDQEFATDRRDEPTISGYTRASRGWMQPGEEIPAQSRIFNDGVVLVAVAPETIRQCVQWGAFPDLHGSVQRQPYGVVLMVSAGSDKPGACMSANFTGSFEAAVELGRLLIAQGKAGLLEFGAAGDAS